MDNKENKPNTLRITGSASLAKMLKARSGGNVTQSSDQTTAKEVAAVEPVVATQKSILSSRAVEPVKQGEKVKALKEQFEHLHQVDEHTDPSDESANRLK